MAGGVLTLFEKRGLAILTLLLPNHLIGMADAADNLAAFGILRAVWDIMR